ncbi:GNAT family N-acetyltransferase [Loktanella agnita]|uniref:GNAT family N-acetyltransferase n=1 Tax=Loktanella agnita TaxID=287097 RepID=UPI003987428B
MHRHSPAFTVTMAETAADLRAAQRLRYDVFVRELGGSGPLVNHAQGCEVDDFDPHASHLLLRDMHRDPGDQVVGTYRLMTEDTARQAGGFYCEAEYDLQRLRETDHKLLELGRSCLHPAYRGGTAMMHLWGALADYVKAHDIGLIFGVASFHGTDVQAMAGPLSLMHDRHLAPAHLRVQAKKTGAHAMNLIPPDQIDRVAAMRDTPALIKAYLRLGAVVGEGAYIDTAFNTTDICLILTTDAISALQRSIYARGADNG